MKTLLGALVISAGVLLVAPAGAQSLGATCAADGECAAGGKCIRPTDADTVLGGGAPAGYCTKVCTGDADCGGTGHCLKDPNGNGECFLGCTIGPPLGAIDEPLDPTKCLGREDVRCQLLGGGVQVCLPTCGTDAQCAGGHCNPGKGTCVSAAPAGKALGETCDPKAMPPECAGQCLQFMGTPVTTMCSTICVLGGVVAGTSDCGGLDKGLCLFTQNGEGAGDMGFCTPPCNAQTDCQNPAFWCFGGVRGATVGFCRPATPCPNGQADCGVSKCTQTTYGPFCLDDTYPLGGGGGAGGAGGGAAGSEGAGAGSGVGPAGATSGAGASGASANDEGSGCGCRAGAGRSSGWLAALAALALTACARRTRRGRRGPQGAASS